MLKLIKCAVGIFIMLAVLPASSSYAQQTAEQIKKADEARRMKAMLQMIGATVDNDKGKQQDIYNKFKNENEQIAARRRAQQQKDNNINDFIQNQARKNDAQRAQSKFYQAQKSEMDAIIAARKENQARQMDQARQVRQARQVPLQRTSVTGSVGSAIGGQIANTGVVGGGAIVTSDTLSIDDIAPLERARPQRTAPATPNVKTKYCVCKGADMPDGALLFCTGINPDGSLNGDISYPTENFPWTSQCYIDRTSL